MTFYFGAPYSTVGGNARASWYGIGGTPFCMFDGDNPHSGGSATGSLFDWYQPTVINQLATASPLLLDTTFDILGNDYLINVDIEVDLPVTTANNRVYFFICIDGLHDQTNMVVDMLPTEDLTITGVGETATVQRQFTLDAAYNTNDMNIIVLVQSYSTKEILQSDQAQANVAGTIFVDAEPDGLNAPWRLQGPNGLDFIGNGDRDQLVSQPGSYTLTWLDVDRWTTPPGPLPSQYLEQDGSIAFSGTYTDGPFDLISSGDVAFAGSSQGVALVDFDSDGDLDIHVVNDGAADQLLRNDGDLVFTDVAAGLLADTGAGRGCAWADMDHDGHPDVYLARSGEANLLLKGDGAGGFTVANTMGTDHTGAAATVSWVDYDLDGNLDLFIMNRSESNVMLKGYGDIMGNGSYFFTAQSGPYNDVSNGGAVVWTDNELDGRLDMYIVNQYAANILLENTPLGFSDMGDLGGVGDVNNGVGAAWGDFDNDGDFDFYLANEGQEDRVFEIYNNGDSFNRVVNDLTKDSGLGRGVVWADFDNDGLLDIYMVRHNQADLLMYGDGLGGFQVASAGFANIMGPGQTVARGDLDGDGDVDLFITQDGAANFILANNGSDVNHFFQVDLTGSPDQPDAIGARVVITADGVTQTRLITAGSGFMSQHSPRAEFGLGTSFQVDNLQVFWPDGTTVSGGPFFVNQTLSVTYGEDLVSGVDDVLPPRTTTLGRAYPNPFNPVTNIAFTLAVSGPVSLDVFTVDGRFVRALAGGEMATGRHTATWDGTDHQGRKVASGSYFYRLQAPDGVSRTGRMVLVK